jgi:hypothetical protein
MSSTQQLLLGEGAGGSAPVYIEDVFSTYLYTGTGTGVTQRIAPGLDLSTKGGMVWVKNRTEVTDHEIYDTARGERKYIRSNTTDAEFDSGANSVQYKTSGWDAFAYTNELNKVMASWSFRKQPKFFDVVTWTGDNVIGREIPHNLGSVPGCIMVKQTNATRDWVVYHTSIGNTKYLTLNSTSPAGTQSFFNNTTPTSTVFTVGDWGAVNGGGNTYVAYLFAHDAGGFGAAGTDNVISCGSYVGNASTTGPIITLGYEPQWVLLKQSSSGGTYWYIVDVLRGMAVAGVTASLAPNSSSAENGYSNMPILKPTATGFQLIQSDSDFNGSGATYIYIAIRRGPMKTPTTPTSVFIPIARTGTGATAVITAPNFVVDSAWIQQRQPSGWQASKVFNRLRGPNFLLYTNTSSAEVSAAVNTLNSFASNVGFTLGNDQNGYSVNMSASGQTYINYAFSRAPSFFDTVYYTGVGGTASFSHNLGVAPELMFVKSRSGTTGGLVYNKTITASKYLKLFFEGESTSGAVSDTGGFAGVEPTSSVFTVGFYSNVNTSGATYVAWLFATCPGVSKVGSYTGNATLTTIDCGFTTGARFVLIKITNTTGNWFVWDSARGMVIGTDPSLVLNSEAAEEPGDSVYTTSVGFQLAASPTYPVNSNGFNYIFLAIA